MLNKNVFKFFFLIFILNGCSKANDEKVSTQMEAFLQDFNAEIFERYNLVTTSFGGEYQQKIKRVVLNFRSEYSIDKTKAVFLIQRISDDLLFYMNRNQELIGYLSSKPFTRNQLEINIDFYDQEKNAYVMAPNVANIKLRQGRLSVHVFDQKENKLIPF